ncbi:MAG: 3,4-dihydroxy-2-butanone-4-phosphate synthase [Phaeodactylibacter sp.]|nr:3,4-dihydroxy-2-butanone-4-phosphate synthase [Phaeodactylibacter sp.]MCB9265383.1 3,4-dihydroxy-2-butanone-4-phosphate synthase [Lewinellaceae bacterium]MCB9288600.1 3,4-dihydroxy-2-butanone-4-phosphate synthase [Lewinellaceae bacterium]
MSGNPLKETVHLKLNTVEEAIADIKAGKVVIVVDDEDRENEGDFICAAECVTPEIINFMATHGRGLICAPIDEKRAEELELDMMVSSNTALHETAFTVSIDLIGQGCTTGISAYDRATGIRALVNPGTKPSDYARPGHIFPLRAKTGGVLRRTGHTEAAIDLARLAGFYPAGVLVEILNEDGTMARLPQLMEIAERFSLRIISIKDLVAYRMRTERIVKKEVSVHLETKYGSFEVIAFRQITTNDIHLAIKCGDWAPEEPVLVRVHSSTETGEILGSLFDDYGVQLQRSIEMISEEGQGLLLYMRHGEKAETILQRLNAYRKKEENGENVALENKTEMTQRDFGVGAQILRELNICKIRQITNNPKRRIGLIGYGLEIVENVPLL